MAPTKEETGRLKLSGQLRGTLMFLAGLGLTVNESLRRDGGERPYLLVLFAAMMGLPLAIGADKARAVKKGDDE